MIFDVKWLYKLHFTYKNGDIKKKVLKILLDLEMIVWKQKNNVAKSHGDVTIQCKDNLPTERLMTGSDRFYIERCLDGHPDDYRYLVRRYQSALVAGLTHRLKNREEAEETAQEAFVRAWFNLGKLKKPGSFHSWLTGIAHRVAREFQRKDKKLLRQKDELSVSPTTSSAEKPPDVDLDRAIADLPDAYREIILLRYYGGQSCREVAESLEIPLGTATKMLSRAYAMLRESLKESGGAL